MTQNSLAAHAHFRYGLTKTIHSRVSRTTSATQRVPEQRLPAAVRAHSRSSLFHVTVELFIMPSIVVTPHPRGRIVWVACVPRPGRGEQTLSGRRTPQI